MKNSKAEQSLQNLGRALVRLEEALQIESPSQLMIDGIIQRFEFVIELYWKTLKRLLAIEGIVINTPKEALKSAFQIGWLENETAWLEMLQDRNQTSHVYDEKLAKKIYQHIKNNYPELKNVYDKLFKKYSKN